MSLFTASVRDTLIACTFDPVRNNRKSLVVLGLQSSPCHECQAVVTSRIFHPVTSWQRFIPRNTHHLKIISIKRTYTFANYQRPVFSLGVSQHMHIILTNLNIWAQLVLAWFVWRHSSRLVKNARDRLQKPACSLTFDLPHLTSLTLSTSGSRRADPRCSDVTMKRVTYTFPKISWFFWKTIQQIIRDILAYESLQKIVKRFNVLPTFGRRPCQPDWTPNLILSLM